MNWFKTKVIAPIASLLRQGMTPNALALSLTAGAMLAVFPVFGVTTFLCVLFATVFRLNQVAIQLANYCAYPLQFLLFLPFLRMGETLFGLESLTINPATVFALARADFSEFIDLYGTGLLSACAAWGLTVIPASLMLWKALSLVIRQFPVAKVAV